MQSSLQDDMMGKGMTGYHFPCRHTSEAMIDHNAVTQAGRRVKPAKFGLQPSQLALRRRRGPETHETRSICFGVELLP